MAGRHAVSMTNGEPVRPFPRETALGSLCAYIAGADARDYQPANITFDLLPSLDEATRRSFKHDKKARHAEVCRRARLAMDRVPGRLCRITSPHKWRAIWSAAARERIRAHHSKL
jgi:NAD(FAD)-utilizing enzyme possibly involved in translation